MGDWKVDPANDRAEIRIDAAHNPTTPERNPQLVFDVNAHSIGGAKLFWNFKNCPPVRNGADHRVEVETIDRVNHRVDVKHPPEIAAPGQAVGDANVGEMFFQALLRMQ